MKKLTRKLPEILNKETKLTENQLDAICLAQGYLGVLLISIWGYLTI